MPLADPNAVSVGAARAIHQKTAAREQSGDGARPGYSKAERRSERIGRSSRQTGSGETARFHEDRRDEAQLTRLPLWNGDAPLAVS